MALEARQPKAMLVCPWLELREPLEFGGLEMMAAGTARERYPVLAGPIAAETSEKYSTGYRHTRSLKDLVEHQRGEEVTFDIEWVEPSVVMLYANEDVERVRTALDALCFASLAENDRSVIYANAEVFRSDVVPLRTDGLSADVQRRMSGNSINGSIAGLWFETRPRWCGQFIKGDQGLLDALAAVIFLEDAASPRNALSALRLASKDASDVPPDVERSFYAMVVARMMDRGAGNDSVEEHRAYAARLFAPILSNGAPNILSVMMAVRHVRNGVWHPKPRKAELLLCERQRLVPFNLIAFRMVEALVIATLHDMGALATESKQVTKIGAIEEWIGTVNALAKEDDEAPMDPSSWMARNERAKSACAIGTIWSHRCIAEGLRRPQARRHRLQDLPGL
jgi:hypothetical protein